MHRTKVTMHIKKLQPVVLETISEYLSTVFSSKVIDPLISEWLSARVLDTFSWDLTREHIVPPIPPEICKSRTLEFISANLIDALEFVEYAHGPQSALIDSIIDKELQADVNHMVARIKERRLSKDERMAILLMHRDHSSRDIIAEKLKITVDVVERVLKQESSKAEYSLDSLDKLLSDYGEDFTSFVSDWMSKKKEIDQSAGHKSHSLEVIVDSDVNEQLFASFLFELSRVYATLSAGDELDIIGGTIQSRKEILT